MDHVNETAGNNNNQINIFERAVAFTIELKRLGTRRKLPTGAVQTDADADCIHVSKDILESPHYEDIKRLDGDIRQYLADHSVPAATLFKSGVILIKLDHIAEIDAAIELYKARRRELVNRFMADYAPAVDRARAKLGSLFDAEDYPAADRVMAAFDMKSKYIEFATPRGLHSISSDIYRREVAKQQADVAQATEEIRQVLRAGLRDLTDHLVERLTPKADGSAKVFRNTLVDNVRDFLDSFNARNIVDDREMEALVTRARGILDGVDPETLRDDAVSRNRVLQNFATIKTELDTMLVDKGRRFNFNDGAE